MLSIEDVQQEFALQLSLLQSATDDREYKEKQAQRVMGAARDLALAVLDGAHSHEGLYRCNCTTWAEGDRCREYRADRAKIKALGKEGDDGTGVDEKTG